MYYLPQPYKCDKCGYEAEYSQSLGWPAPVLYGEPSCPKCFAEFIKAHCGTMRYVKPAAPPNPSQHRKAR